MYFCLVVDMLIFGVRAYNQNKRYYDNYTNIDQVDCHESNFNS